MFELRLMAVAVVAMATPAWRTAPGYTRTGGYLAVTGHHFGDTGDEFSFERVDYDVIQHIPVMRDTWVVSLRGRVEAESFDPLTWKPRVPTAAFIEMRDDDAFWAALRVMAFEAATIRGLVEVAAFSDPAAAAQLTATLIARRDKIGRAYLTRISPIVDPVLNEEGTSALGETRSALESMTAPASLRATPGTFVKIEIAASAHRTNPGVALCPCTSYDNRPAGNDRIGANAGEGVSAACWNRRRR